jgi:hypothetical protein
MSSIHVCLLDITKVIDTLFLVPLALCSGRMVIGITMGFDTILDMRVLGTPLRQRRTGRFSGKVARSMCVAGHLCVEQAAGGRWERKELLQSRRN